MAQEMRSGGLRTILYLTAGVLAIAASIYVYMYFFWAPDFTALFDVVEGMMEKATQSFPGEEKLEPAPGIHPLPEDPG